MLFVGRPTDYRHSGLSPQFCPRWPQAGPRGSGHPAWGSMAKASSYSGAKIGLILPDIF
jgi:hypothetical protein